MKVATRLSSPKSCPTKPKLCIVDRSCRPRKRGALHNQDLGEVGRTSAKRRVRQGFSPLTILAQADIFQALVKAVGLFELGDGNRVGAVPTALKQFSIHGKNFIEVGR
jgi:hypothetical protein